MGEVREVSPAVTAKLYGQVPGGQAELLRVPFGGAGLGPAPPVKRSRSRRPLGRAFPTAERRCSPHGR